MNLSRFFEKITGRPHQHHNAERVTDVVAALSCDVRKLTESLQPYVEANDPLVEFMTDVFNKRQMSDPPKNENNGR
jgi:hypothetical protein